ncbi:MAG: hypothetical protein ACFFD4_01130 [Candidatus Odinarchaeota archaeon]
MLEDLRLEEIVEKFGAIVEKVIDPPPCAAGRALASLYYQFLSKSLEGNSTAAKICLKYLKENLNTLIDQKQPAFGIFLHSFTAQFASVTLQLEVMSENCIRWMEGEEYLRIPCRTVDELLDIVPCMSVEVIEHAFENMTLNDDLSQLMAHFRPEQQLQEFYLKLIHRAIVQKDAGARLRLLEIQTAIQQVIKNDRGLIVHDLAKSWYMYQLKLRLWVTNFLETTEDPEFSDELKKFKLRQAASGKKTLRQVITEYQSEEQNTGI